MTIHRLNRSTNANAPAPINHMLLVLTVVVSVVSVVPVVVPVAVVESVLVPVAVLIADLSLLVTELLDAVTVGVLVAVLAVVLVPVPVLALSEVVVVSLVSSEHVTGTHPTAPDMSTPYVVALHDAVGSTNLLTFGMESASPTQHA
jgi:hypothetical protein